MSRVAELFASMQLARQRAAAGGRTAVRCGRTADCAAAVAAARQFLCHK